MNMPTWIKPGAWGVIVGAGGAMIIGFAWGGWMTTSTAQAMATEQAKTAVVAAYTPICVANAKKAAQEQLAALKAEESWLRDDFVIKAGWVANVDKAYRSAVADACAPKVIAAMDATTS